MSGFGKRTVAAVRIGALGKTVAVGLAAALWVSLFAAVWAQTPPTPTPVPSPTPIPPVSADTVVYRPTEINPGPTTDIYRPVYSRDTRCDEFRVSSPDGSMGEWDVLNCQVKRVVEGIVAVGVGVAILAVVWAGVHMITSVDERGGSGDRVRRMITGTIFGVIAMLCCYILAGLVDLGLQFNLPGNPGNYIY